ncbi:MAG: hypothetical protein VKI83_06850 [Synechococcaceae cyanobacterium]|nr:hypothetical protein [Synechococcaceae cyanobacterium]
MRDQPPEPPDDAAAMTPAASWLPMTQASSSRALQAAGLVFAVLFFVQISVIALPLSLSDPGQLLSVISEAITLSSMLLLSMLFLFIAEAIQPADANYDWEPQIHRN